MPGIDLAFFNRLGFFMGVAFQIQDDLLNLVGEEARYGKEIAGNIWEGKRTVMLMNLTDRCSGREKRRVVDLLSKPRTEKTADEVEYVFKLMKNMDASGMGSKSRENSRSRRTRFSRGSLGGFPTARIKLF